MMYGLNYITGVKTSTGLAEVHLYEYEMSSSLNYSVVYNYTLYM